MVDQWGQDGIREGVMDAKRAGHVLCGVWWCALGWWPHLWMVALVYANGVLPPITDVDRGEE